MSNENQHEYVKRTAQMHIEAGATATPACHQEVRARVRGLLQRRLTRGRGCV